MFFPRRSSFFVIYYFIFSSDSFPNLEFLVIVKDKRLLVFLIISFFLFTFYEVFFNLGDKLYSLNWYQQYPEIVTQFPTKWDKPHQLQSQKEKEKKRKTFELPHKSHMKKQNPLAWKWTCKRYNTHNSNNTTNLIIQLLSLYIPQNNVHEKKLVESRIWGAIDRVLYSIRYICHRLSVTRPIFWTHQWIDRRTYPN